MVAGLPMGGGVVVAANTVGGAGDGGVGAQLWEERVALSAAAIGDGERRPTAALQQRHGPFAQPAKACRISECEQWVKVGLQGGEHAPLLSTA